MPGWMKWTIALIVGLGIIVVGFRLAYPVLVTFFVINCLVLIVVVLLQSGKAADLAGAFGGAGSQTAFGPRGAANVLSRATTWCAIMFMLCAMAMVLRTDKAVGQSGSILQRVSQPAKTPAKTPATTPPASAPATTPNPNNSAAPATNPNTSGSSPASQPPPQTPPANNPPKKP